MIGPESEHLSQSVHASRRAEYPTSNMLLPDEKAASTNYAVALDAGADKEEALRLEGNRSPFDASKELKPVFDRVVSSKDYFEAALGYHEVSSGPADEVIREENGLGKEAGIIWSGSGSDQLLKDMVGSLIAGGWTKERPFRILGFSPQFPTVGNTARLYKEVSYGTRSVLFNQSLDDKIRETMEKYQEMTVFRGKDTAIYICQGNNPTGDTVSRKTTEELVEFCAKRGILVIYDEAHGELLDPDERLERYAEDYPNIIAMRSFKQGIPGLRLGYAVMSPEIAKKWKEVTLPFGISGPQQLIANALLETGAWRKYLNSIGPEIIASKSYILGQLGMKLEADMLDGEDSEDPRNRFRVNDPWSKIAATDLRTGIFVYDGEKDLNLVERLRRAKIYGVYGGGYISTVNYVGETFPNMSQAHRFYVPMMRDAKRLVEVLKGS